MGAGPAGLLLGRGGGQHQAPPHHHACVLRRPPHEREQASGHAHRGLRDRGAARGQRNDRAGDLPIANIQRPGHRVLVTGVSHYLGGELARRLEAREDVAAIYGIDIDDPRVALERTEFVHADTRHSLLTKLVRGLGVDTVVHCAVMTEGRTGARTLHETNVIGTMNLLAACSGADSPVRRMVVRSSVAVYGCEPFAPSYLRESHEESAQTREFLANDLREMDQLVSDFQVRNGSTTVTLLRLGHRLGFQYPTPLGEYFLLSRVPTFHGFDPRLQLLHDDDAMEALYRAAAADHGGVFNVAGGGGLLLSQAIPPAGPPQPPRLLPLLRGLPRGGVRAARGCPAAA